MPNNAVDTARKFGERRSGESFDELRAIGRKHCLLFVLGLLLHVDSAFDM